MPLPGGRRAGIPLYKRPNLALVEDILIARDQEGWQEVSKIVNAALDELLNQQSSAAKQMGARAPGLPLRMESGALRLRAKAAAMSLDEAFGAQST